MLIYIPPSPSPVEEALMLTWFGHLPELPSLPWGLMVQSGLAHLSLPVSETKMIVRPEGSFQEVFPTPGCLHPSSMQMCAYTHTHTDGPPHTHHILHIVLGFHIHQKAVWQTHSLTQSIPSPAFTGMHISKHITNLQHVNTLSRHGGQHKPRTASSQVS